jgi:hypothetical protein
MNAITREQYEKNGENVAESFIKTFFDKKGVKYCLHLERDNTYSVGVFLRRDEHYRAGLIASKHNCNATSAFSAIKTAILLNR